MFISNLIGTLMKVEPNPDTRFVFEIWFDYTKQAINLIREGAMIAVSNFATNQNESHMSILEITSILPMHYALGSDTSGYPGFVEEAARSAALDWEQDKESTEDTTKIKCVAIPTNMEVLLQANNDPAIQEEENLPMVGSRVNLFDTNLTQRIVNLGIDPEQENILTVGQLIRNEQVDIWLRIEDLIKVHFGIFGFTGAGKSNFVSTMSRRILTESSDPVKIVIFDLMSEYTCLLIDQLVENPRSGIVNLGELTVPQSLLRYYADQNEQNLRQATQDMLRSTLLPKGLKRRQGEFEHAMQQLLESRRVRVWREQDRTIGQFAANLEGEVLKGNMGNSATTVRQFFDTFVNDFWTLAFTQQNWEQARQRLDQFLGQTLTTTAANNIRRLKQNLEAEFNRPRVEIPQAARVTVPDIINLLNDTDCSAVIIIQAHDPDELRNFANLLGNLTYEARRRTGQITPLVSFVFDEADEFIPQQAKDSYAASTEVAMTLARRGRKFGLGICIATQRVRYLNTSIMAQPHTYFISKLPRQTDRQVVAEAFGISEDMFSQTFKFKKGDWLVASYDAAGLEAVPVPIHVENAENPIIEFLEQTNTQTENNGVT